MANPWYFRRWLQVILLVMAIVLSTGCTREAPRDSSIAGGLNSSLENQNFTSIPGHTMHLPSPSTAGGAGEASAGEPAGQWQKKPLPIFSRTFSMITAGLLLVIFPEEYGVGYLSPGIVYSLSIDSERPVNLLVVDSIYENSVRNTRPVFEIQPSRAPDRSRSYEYGFSYGFPVILQEDNVMKKTLLFSVPRMGKYLVVADPRSQGKVTGTKTSYSVSHELFRTTLTLERVMDRNRSGPGTISGVGLPGLINEVIGLSTDFSETSKIYALDEYGMPQLFPNDTLHLMISSSRPVNILILDEEAMEVYHFAQPELAYFQNRTVKATRRGFTYGPISPHNGEIYHEDESLDTDVLISIPRVSKYYVIIDPRYASEYISSPENALSFVEDYVRVKVYIEKLEVGSALYWKRMGDSCMKAGRYDQAESYYRTSVALDPKNPDTWYNMGIVLRDLGRYREAIRAFHETLQITPGDPDVWERIGTLYMVIEDEVNARDAYNRSQVLLARAG